MSIGVELYDPAGQERFAGAWIEGRNDKDRGRLRVAWNIRGDGHNWFRVHAYARSVLPRGGEAVGGVVGESSGESSGIRLPSRSLRTSSTIRSGGPPADKRERFGTLTPRRGDHGRDVIAIKKGICSIRVIDQVKAYKPPHLVAANDVRALMGVLQGDGASKGCLSTTSDFAPMIKTDPLIVPFIPSRLELVNGTAIFSRLEELAARQKT
jgi:hypothetical protein